MCFPPVKNLPFILKKNIFLNLSRGFESVNRCPTARVEEVREDGQMKKREMMESG